jgi:pyruvate dehydrogenase E1 component alpha subunit
MRGFALRSLQDAHAANPRHPASDEELLKFYEQMLLIRRFEEKAGQLYGLGLIGGFCHLYIGQEAVAVGLQSALDSERDSVITGYRDHGHMLAYGIDPKVIMAELTGRGAGISKGKGGSMHMFSVDHKFYGGHGIVGAQVPLGTGLAFAHKYREDGGVCMAYFGDGAANQGQVYEAFNMAALWKLPIVFVVENNQYAMGTAVSAVRPKRISTAAAPRSASPACTSTAWTCWKSRKAAEDRAGARSRGNGPGADGLTPIAIAAIRCPTRPSTAAARKCRKCARSTIRSRRQGGTDRARHGRGIAQGHRQAHPRSGVSEAADFAEIHRSLTCRTYTDVLVESY